MPNKQLSVNISPEKSYPIFINKDSIETLADKVKPFTSATKFLIVISEKVNKLYGEKFSFENSVKFVLKDGEKEKNFKNYEKILNFAQKNKLERKDCIIAIGGGVVGDIAGFVAATYLRGVDFIQIPTTLLACVDSSVGGKVAINTKFGKNLVGAFYQPKAVFCNLNFLKTLDERQFKTGLSEVVKYAFIEKSATTDINETFFDFLWANCEKIKEQDEEVLAQIIETSLKIKASVVSEDEKESGLRKILNFGHTLAHAIENITNYKKFTHGEAVAIGMKYAIKLSAQKKLIDADYEKNCQNLIDKFEIVKTSPKFKREKLIELMLSDKKVENGEINFILSTAMARAEAFVVKTNEINF